MAEDYCLTWNAWRVWLHPRQALDELEDAGFMQENLESRLNDTAALLEEQKNESLRLSEESGELTRRLAEKEMELDEVKSTLESTRRELREVREVLVEQEEIDRQMREFDAALTKVEDMKRRYEKRIAELEAMLRDARQAGRRCPETELIDPLDYDPMSAAPRETIDMSSRQDPVRIIPPSPSLGSGNKKSGVAGVRNPGEARMPRQERNVKPGQDAGDDWLLELPEDL